MLRRAWKPVLATTALVGAPAYVYYRFQHRAQTFDVPVRTRGADGRSIRTTRTLEMLRMDAVNARLAAHAEAHSAPRPGGIVWRHATASLAANDPIEDASASAIVERDAADPSAPGDLLFFTVMDGHAGPHTSRLLSKILIHAVVLELSALAGDAKAGVSKWGGLWRLGASALRPFSARAEPPAAAYPERVAQAIRTAFARLDAQLLQAPVHLLRVHFDDAARKTDQVPDLSRHPMALATMQPAMSGSCALMAVLDTAHRDMYVACTGDSRAVAGVWEAGADGRGAWRVEVLSEDQTGRNPKEAARMRAEHPPDEAQDVIRNGRVLGSLEPSRAFGDARYKWPAELQAVLQEAFLTGNNMVLRAPAAYRTPPYVTAEPVVTHRALSFLPLPEPPAPAPAAALRFVIMATDGLWDQLSAEEAVALVGGYLAGLKGSVPKRALPALVPTAAGTPAVEGKDKDRARGAAAEGAWAFVDDNVSTHLIRNAFGGADEQGLRRLLSIPAPLARRYRDDTTVTVLWWEDGREQDAQIASVPAAKAKL